MRPTHQETLLAIRRSVEQDDDSILLPEQQEHRQRLEGILTQMLGQEHTLKSLCEWVVNEYGCKMWAAHAWVRDCKELFGDLLPSNRGSDALLMSMQLERWLQDADLIDDMEARLNTKAKLMRELVRIRGLDRGDDASMDPGRLTLPKVSIGLPRDVRRFVRTVLMDGVVQLPAPEVEEAEIIEETDIAPSTSGEQ